MSCSVSLRNFTHFTKMQFSIKFPEVNKVLSKIRSFNFKFSLRFRQTTEYRYFFCRSLPMNTTLVIVSYFFHLIIQKLFIHFFPHCLLQIPPSPTQLTACVTPTHSGIFILKIVTLRVYSKTKSVLPSDYDLSMHTASMLTLLPNLTTQLFSLSFSL